MTAREIYDEIGANYDEMIGRVMMDALISKFCAIFVGDDSYSKLANAIADDCTEEAFKAAHTLKGVSANMAFTQLTNVASEITEALRAGNLDKAKVLMPQVTAEYEKTIVAINKLDS